MNVIVIGGGAAGFFGAIAAAEANPHSRVTILEASQQVLAKVRISGGGRCNVTHHCFEPASLIQHYPRGGKALRGAFTRFQPTDTVAWFGDRGVVLKTEADGRMFPITDDSATIVHCLQEAAAQAGVCVRTSTAVTAVRAQPNPSGSPSPFEVQLKSGEILTCDRLLLATGSSPQGHRLARQLGHAITPLAPSLFTFTLADPELTQLAGLSVPRAELTLLTPTHKFQQTGPLLITHWGLSGPAVLKLSAWGARALKDNGYRAKLQVNWLPDHSLAQVQQQLEAGRTEVPRKQVLNHRPFLFPQRLWAYWVQRAAISPDTRWADLSKKASQRLVQELHRGEFEICGKGAFKDEFVTCGGVHLGEVTFQTMESKVCPGLHFAGELLDIDGVTGGFNFQNAWTTGWLAGQAIAQPLPNPHR